MIKRGLVTVLLLWSSLPGLAAEYIESFHSEIEVRRNGDLHVTESIRVQAEGKSIRRGIYRDFPTRYRDTAGRDMIVGFEVLAVKRDGNNEPFHIEDRSNGKRVYIGDKNTYLTPGIYEYQLSYRSTRQLGFFDDFDELYWNVTGNGWAFEIRHASAEVTLPGNVEDFRLAGYTGPRGSTAQDLVYRRSGGNRVYFETTHPLNRYEGLTIVAGWPKGLVAEPSAAQKRAWFVKENKASLIVVGGALALLVYYLLLWHWLGRDPDAGVIVPRYEPPGEYSPASMRFLQNMGYDKKCFTAAIINLAVKGVIEIDDDDGDFKLRRINATDANLAAGETQVLGGLFILGKESIDVSQSNHSTLSKAIGRHKKSLKRDYEKKFFNTNSWLVVPGVLASIILIASAIASLSSEEIIVKTVFFSFFFLIPVKMIFAAWHGFRQRGIGAKIQMIVNIVILLILAGVFTRFGSAIAEFSIAVPKLLVAGVAAMLIMHYLFYGWLKAPTLAGRRLLDKIEGFKHYLEVAEEDEIAMVDAPEFTVDLYESYLPYAIALDLENEWTARLDRAIAIGLVAKNYSHPRWYHAHNHGGRHFSNTLSNAFNSAIASSSVAPGSSSGSSGGSSGGGGGGGGGGGW